MSKHNPIQATNYLQKIMRSSIGDMLAHSWLDPWILRSVEYWFFPMSRLWAAARRANGDVDVFFDSVPLPMMEDKREKVKKALKEFEHARQLILGTEHQWQDQFFSKTPPDTEILMQLEDQRLKDRSHYNATRRQFSYLRKHVKTTVSDNFITEAELEKEYNDDELNFQQRFDPPSELPNIEVSQSIPTVTGRDYWVRFKSPAPRLKEDMVYARVHEPEGVENPPTLIFGHGIGVEFDHWRNLIDVAELLPHLGIRVIRPEGAWHGRRVPDGYYGGEYFLSTTPIGAFDYFTSQHQEWATLIDWSRKTSNGPVAIGGSSLGAQSAQMLSIRANHWDKHFQPDALFLMTHCSHLWEVALDGELADIWRLGAPLHALGWNRERMEYWLSKLDPKGIPCMPAENIVSVLGKQDRVTPYNSGKRLQELWNLPDNNRFTWNCGHFTVPLRMASHHEPLMQLKTILDRLAG